jgi:hypothetical protein
MKNAYRTGVLAGVLAVLALLAASVGASQAPAAAQTPQAAQTADSVKVTFTINRFVRQGRRIVAKGQVIARYDALERAPVIVRKNFTARIGARSPSLAASTRICTVLELTIEQLDLNLLGLMVHLDRVHLLITADSNGGLLGSLFCSIAGPRAGAARLQRSATRMTRAARQHGLNRGVTGFRVQVAPGLAQAGTICPILDLVLGPIDLNLLGLMIHLDRVHLTITAERGGGILGDLLCSVAGGPPPPAPTARAPTTQ